MMKITYLVDPLSALDIELSSAGFLKKYQPDVLLGEKPLNLDFFLDNIFKEVGATLQLVK